MVTKCDHRDEARPPPPPRATDAAAWNVKRSERLCCGTSLRMLEHVRCVNMCSCSHARRAPIDTPGHTNKTTQDHAPRSPDTGYVPVNVE